jgi:hypothetical protein
MLAVQLPAEYRPSVTGLAMAVEVRTAEYSESCLAVIFASAGLVQAWHFEVVPAVKERDAGLATSGRKIRFLEPMESNNVT